MFTQLNTVGYTDEELANLNNELKQLLDGVEYGTDKYYKIVQQFNHDVTSR